MLYALKGKYPIETKDQLVKTAKYFDRFLSSFHPTDRVTASYNMEKRAEQLRVDLEYPWLENYSRAMGSRQVSPDFEHYVDMRKQACVGKMGGSNVEAMLNKIKGNIGDPDRVVDQLFAFDKTASLEYQWDNAILDPIMTVFGSLRNAEYDAVKIAGSVTDYELKKIACDDELIGMIKTAMGAAVARSFLQDPVGTVSKMTSLEKDAFLTAIGK